MFKSAHRVALICTVIIFAVVDAGLYAIDFASMIMDGFSSSDITTQAWSLVSAAAWLGSFIFGGACAGELVGRVWRKYR